MNKEKKRMPLKFINVFLSQSDMVHKHALSLSMILTVIEKPDV